MPLIAVKLSIYLFYFIFLVICTPSVGPKVTTQRLRVIRSSHQASQAPLSVFVDAHFRKQKEEW